MTYASIMRRPEQPCLLRVKRGVEASPVFFDGDTVAQGGTPLKGEFARTLNLNSQPFATLTSRRTPVCSASSAHSTELLH